MLILLVESHIFKNYWYIALILRMGEYLIRYLVKKKKKNTTAAAAAAKSLQSCPTLCNPMDSSLPGSPVPGILQARTLEWVAISFSNA